MEQHQIAEWVEKHLTGNLNAEEQHHFDALRKSNPEMDQHVVEYHFFLEEMEKYGEVRRFKSNLYDTHHTLQENGEIKNLQLKAGAKIINLWSKYRRVVAVAASIAGITALFISGMISIFSPNAPIRDLEELRRKVNNLEKQSSKQITEFNKIKTKIEPGADVKFGGTSFMLDASGYLVTSAHVLKGARKVFVQNNEGKDFLVEIVHQDLEADIALMKINDADFKSGSSLPYGFSRKRTDLSEPVYTLGFPKDEIVYNEGYLSAQTGLDGDTMTCQITITANPGNSGGPVFNKNGEVIGILNARQASANGVVFATKSKNIYRFIESLKDTDKDLMIRMKSASTLKGANRSSQVKKVQDHIYMVKVVLG